MTSITTMQKMNYQLQPLPTLDIENGIFRAWWFDPLTATVAFAVIINWYWWHERRLGLSDVKELKFGVLNALSQPARATAGYWIGIYMWRILIPPPAATLPDGVPTSPTEVAYLLVEVVSGIVLYDAIFFVFHMAMHEIPMLRHFHHQHHDTSKGTLESRDVLRHSFVDASLQVLVNILVQRHTFWGAVKSRLARMAHNILVVWFLTESHTVAPTPYVWRHMLVGVREHRLHHLASNNNDDNRNGYYGHNHRYQQFFGYLDELRAWYIEWKVQRKLLVKHSRQKPKFQCGTYES